MTVERKRSVSTVSFGALLGVIGMVLGYLVMPLATRVEENTEKLHSLDIKMISMEKDIQYGFGRMEERFDELLHNVKVHGK